MAWRCVSLSRSVFSAARTVQGRSSPSSMSGLHNLASPSLRSHFLHSRRRLISVPRNMGQLGCAQSLMPLHSAVATTRLTSHTSVLSRACCELSQGT